MGRSVCVKPEYLKEFKETAKRFGTQQTLAKKAGLARATVSKLLKGERVDKNTLIKLADILGFDERVIAQTDEDLNITETESSPANYWDRPPRSKTELARNEELTTLRRWLFQEDCQVLNIYGPGKVGKTDIVAELYSEAQNNNHFEGGIWIDFRGGALTVEQLLERIVEKVAKVWPKAASVLEKDRLTDKISRLVDFLETHRYLIVLKRIDELFQVGELCGRYKSQYRDYEELFSQLYGHKHTSCWIIIGRQPPYDVLSASHEDEHARSFHLKGLNKSEATDLLKRGLQRKDLSANKAELKQIVQVYMGHPWWLQQLPSNMNTGTVEQFLKQDLFVFNSCQEILDEHFDAISSLEKSILFWLAINREPVTATLLYEEDIAAQARKGRLLEALKSLRHFPGVIQRDDTWEISEIVRRFMSKKLINRLYSGFIDKNVEELNNYPLLKVTGSDHVRLEQLQFVLYPLLEQLKQHFGSINLIETRIQELLQTCQHKLTDQPGYAAGNLLNLWIHLKKQGCDRSCNPELHGLNLSGLFLWQADLTQVTLKDVNLSNARLSKTLILSTCTELLSMAQSLDGRTIAVGDTGGQVHIYRVSDEGKLIPELTYQAHSHWVRNVSVSSDGRYVASGGEDQSVYVWKIEKTQAVLIFRGSHNHRLRDVAFSPKQKNLLVSAGDDGQLILWDIQRKRKIKNYFVQNDKLRAIVFSSDGKFLVSASAKGKIFIHSLSPTGNFEKFLQPRSFTAHTPKNGGKLRAIALSPNNLTLATGGDDGWVRLWNVSNHQSIKSSKHHQDWIRGITFSPDGKNVASSGEDFKINFWDSQTGRHMKEFLGHRGRVWSILFDFEGKRLFSASGDQTLKTWNVTNGKCLNTIQGYASKIRSVSFSPDGKQLVSGSDDRIVRLWDLKTKQHKKLHGHEGPIWSTCFTHDGAYIASGSEDKTVIVWNTATQKIHTRFENDGHTNSGHTSWVRSVAAAPHSLLVASGGDDFVVCLHDIDHCSSCKPRLKHDDWILALDFGQYPNDNRLLLASASDDKAVRVWDIEADELIFNHEEHQEPVRAIALSPDCRWVVSGSNDKTVRLCNITERRCLPPVGRQEDAHDGWVYSVAFHPEFSQRQIIASASYDHTIKLWDVSQLPATCKTLTGHGGAVVSIAFSPDGKQLASGSEDDTIRLWDLSNIDKIKCIDILKLPGPYESMNITNVDGLTSAQKGAFIQLGAIDKLQEI